MGNSYFQFLMRTFTSRWIFLLLNAIVIFFSVDGIYYFFNEVLFGAGGMGPDGHPYSNATFGGIAIMLMALGVLMGLRAEMMKMGEINVNVLQGYLNDVANRFGVGLLIIGLFMEIITILILLPNAVINTSGVELFLYSVAVFINCVSIFIGLNFMRQYLATYFKKI